MAGHLSLGELNQFIANPASYLHEGGAAGLDARISALSETLKTEPCLLAPIPQEFLKKITQLTEIERSKVEPLSLQLFLQSFGLVIKGGNHSLWEALLLLPVTACQNQATLQATISLFNGTIEDSTRLATIRAIEELPEEERVLVIELASPKSLMVISALRSFVPSTTFRQIKEPLFLRLLASFLPASLMVINVSTSLEPSRKIYLKSQLSLLNA